MLLVTPVTHQKVCCKGGQSNAGLRRGPIRQQIENSCVAGPRLCMVFKTIFI